VGRAAAELDAQGWRAYAVDARGHGDSDRSAAAAYSYADSSAEVLALCAGMTTPPLVIGGSMGGVAAMVAHGGSDAQLYRGLVQADITPDIDLAGARRILSFMATDPNGYADLDEAAEAIAAYRGPGRGKASASGLSRVLTGLRHRRGNLWRSNSDARPTFGSA
jgi:pimeloyl-ACP methyl ester carboxylesterase